MKQRRVGCAGALSSQLAVITLQGAAECSARIYPGPELTSFKVLRQGLVSGVPAGLDRDYYVQVNLERRKAPQPLPTATPQLRIA
jgi:hypothetical protein